MKKRTLLYLILIISLVLSIFVEFFGHENVWVDKYMPNLTSELFGIIFVILFVEKLVQFEKDEENNRLRLLASKKLKRPTGLIARMFADMIKSSMDTTKDYGELPKTFSDLFKSDKLLEELQFFDFQKKAPVVPKESWLRHSHLVLTENLKSINDVLNRYSTFLDLDFLNAFETLENNPLIGFCKQAVPMPQVRAEAGFDDSGKAYLLFAGNVQFFRENIQSLVSTMAQLERFGIKLDLGNSFWSNTIAPKMGDSRYA